MVGFNLTSQAIQTTSLGNSLPKAHRPWLTCLGGSSKTRSPCSQVGSWYSLGLRLGTKPQLQLPLGGKLPSLKGANSRRMVQTLARLGGAFSNLKAEEPGGHQQKNQIAPNTIHLFLSQEPGGHEEEKIKPSLGGKPGSTKPPPPKKKKRTNKNPPQTKPRSKSRFVARSCPRARSHPWASLKAAGTPGSTSSTTTGTV